MQQLQQLTEVRLAFLACRVILPGLPSALQRLAVQRSGSVDPQTLAGLRQLQTLDLIVTPAAGGAGGIAALLQHVGQMTQLTRLNLAELLHDSAPAAAAAHAALTASRSLAKLSLTWCWLPAAACQAMCGGTKLPPRLQELSLGSAEASARITAADMTAVVRYCSALHKLCAKMLHAAVDLCTLGVLMQLQQVCMSQGCSCWRSWRS